MSDTKVCGRCEDVKCLTEFNKHKVSPDGIKWECRECQRTYRKAYYAKNHIKAKADVKLYVQNNRGRKNYWLSKRHAAKLQRTVAWADKAKIKDIYDRASALQEATGIPMNVDHVYPLQGERVSGLHVETNLQILPAVVNFAKSNKYKIE